ncbi:hypothetical protein [Helicobacter burdigaliensis]|uniref:hypothetical protein n=1 Tax=Helicobacter burdigaliensis TaxID=2315334 RepID=UPI000EF6B57C|nr:hypothetical protein [Helicobacter burdigaliensis]
MNDKTLLIKDDVIGERSELGSKLILGFLSTLKSCATLPSSIFLLNRGVLLATTNEDSIKILKDLENLGIKIYSCQTCLESLEVMDKLQVGKVGNAKDTLEALLNSSNAISL